MLIKSFVGNVFLRQTDKRFFLIMTPKKRGIHEK